MPSKLFALLATHEGLEAAVRERTADLAHANQRLEAEIAARKQVEEERRVALARLVEAQEEERRRISREMHDQMGQHLTALSLGLQTLKEMTPPNAKTAPLLARMQEVTDDLGREAHRLAVALRPTSLDDLGLVDALRSHTEEWSEHTSVRTEFHASGATDAPGAGYRFLPSEVQITLYRVVQEALTNVAKYAEASRVSVLLSLTPDHVLLIVEDDGKGFDAGKLLKIGGAAEKKNSSAVVAVKTTDFPAKPARPHLGLWGMRERVALVGGTLDIESSSDQGTTLYVRLPVLAGG